MTSKKDSKDILEFPCPYQFKALGASGEVFFQAVVAAVNRHAPTTREAIRSRPSGKGNYQAVSILVTLHSYQQLTDIYAEIRLVKDLKMLL